MLGLLIVAAIAASCSGPIEPSVIHGDNSLVVSYGGVEMTLPRDWRIVNRQLPTCGGTPSSRTVYIWTQPSGPAPNCHGGENSISYVSWFCLSSSGAPVSSTSTTVLGGLKALVQDQEGDVGVWLPSGYPFIDIHVPLDDRLARQLLGTVRSASGHC
jgi:hypothetical protein